MIELLVVIAIIAILAALLMPALEDARKRARRVSCLSNERQLFVGLTMYVNDNADRLPPFYRYPSGGNWISGYWARQTTTHGEEEFYSFGLLAREDYLPVSGGALVCPGYRSMGTAYGAHTADLYRPNGSFWLQRVIDGEDIYPWWAARYIGPYTLATMLYCRTGWSYPGHDLTHAQRDAYPAAAKLNNRGVPGPTEAADVGAYARHRITALIQCSYPGPHPHLSQDKASIHRPDDAGAHRKEGWNTVYRDGHAGWVPLSADVLSLFSTNRTYDYGNLQHQRHSGFWPYATYYDEAN